MSSQNQTVQCTKTNRSSFVDTVCYFLYEKKLVKKNKHARSSGTYAYAYVAVIPGEDNIRKTSVFVLLMLRAYDNACAYELVKASLNICFA